VGSPNWYSRETANIKLFTHNLPMMPGKLAFIFCTHGTGPNGQFGSLSELVMKRKLTIIGWNDWYGSVFHVLHQPKPYHTDGHPDKIDLDEAEAFGTMIGQKAQKIYAGDKSLIPDIPTTGSLWTSSHGGPSSGGGAPGAGAPGAGGAGKQTMPAAAGAAVAVGGSGAPKMGGAASGGGAPNGGGPGGPQMGGGAPSGGGPGGPQMGGGAPNGAPGGGGPGGAPGGQVAAAPHKVAAKVVRAGAGGASMPGGGPPGGMGGPAISTKLPTFFMDKCVYPRCNACEDVCPVNAIDFSMVTPGRLSSGDQVLVKKACISCSLCERVCIYDAVVQGDNGPRPKTSHAIDMAKCTYPKCQLCLDNCPMNAIDFSHNPPVFHHDCEGCDMCYCVCPTGAVSIPNLAISQGAMANRGGGGGPASMNGGDIGDTAALDPENVAKRLQGISPSSSPFRRLVPKEQIGYDHIIMDNLNKPLIIVDPQDGNTTYCSSPCKVQKS